jgi:hypothetical protein
MIIRRDNMGAAYPSLQIMPNNPIVSVSPAKTPLYVPVATAEMSTTAPQTMPHPPSARVAYALNPLQQHRALQREAFERDRKLLLRKASNFGGESVERVISDYLAI